ncbi:hypothetical protein [Culicoidibacter larvae]|uniref:Uncharacterized protein n=1 Tax=Culicoidibacter larvae TaxID=2579976 RepID=A0A5R8Q7F1_9FIRM|nr:hypothetical protein [Culicoidibacter larvae]TLG71377.1 hypothetical protein FEZ08_10810 [Culicoidibacter larvae]
MRNAILEAKEGIELMYFHTCTISRRIAETGKPGKSNGQATPVHKLAPCYLSEKIKTVPEEARAVIEAKLFISPEYDVQINDVFDIDKGNGILLAYRTSSKPVVYDTHQEIILQGIQNG